MESTENTNGLTIAAVVATAGVALAPPASLAAQTATTGLIDQTAGASATHGSRNGCGARCCFASRAARGLGQ